jgi:hypothetical protein
MQVCRVETTVLGDGTVVLKDVPFPPGETVEVVVRTRHAPGCGNAAYPLRGKPVRYLDPFEGIAEEDWEALG